MSSKHRPNGKRPHHHVLARTEARTWIEAACLAAVAGMRSLLAPAIVGSRQTVAHGSIGRWLQDPRVARNLGRAAAVEVLIDKLPFAPSRSATLPFIGRALWGAVVAIAWTDARGPARIASAALLGGSAAAATGHALALLRKRTMRRAGNLANALAGLAEDVVAFSLAQALTRPRAT